MNEKNKWRISNQSLYQSTRQASFTVGATRMVVEDRVYAFSPARSERILRMAGTGIYYSVVPLDPYQHRLLCYEYCDDALELRPFDYYRNALVLGCGGGAIPRWLLEKYPDLAVDVVDRSAKMIEISQTYFLFRWEDSDRLRYVCTDAQEYEAPAYPYQFIFCDMFNGTDLAPFVYTKSYAAKLRRMMSEDGMLAINCGWGHLNEILAAYRSAFAYVEVVNRPSWQTEVVRASGSRF